MNILFLVPYPLKESPSQRFRFEQYFKILQEQGHSYHVESFFELQSWRHFYKSGQTFTKAVSLISGFSRRILTLGTLFKFDFVFIHREATPIGPPIFEWLISRLFQKKIIYDFDDALWVTDRLNESVFFKALKWRSKIKAICRWSHRISCGNEFLCHYARQFNNQVTNNPTTVDTESLHNPHHLIKHDRHGLIIGWTGSHSTLKYLKNIEDILQDIERDFPQVQFMVIADQKPELNLKSLIFKPWSFDSEIEDLYQFDIGIMPLPEDEWSKGKCGFKALQYMALQIPTIASPVGVNNAIINHGVNGFLASSSAEWKGYLKLLIGERDLRTKVGKKGREQVIDHYSVLSNEATFLALFV